jgi:hypothetical protein
MKNLVYKVLVSSVVVLTMSHQSFAKDVCSDAYMAAAIQSEANEASSATGLCSTARAGIKLYKKSIKLVDKCLHIDSLRAYKTELENMLQQSEEQAAATCS